MFQTGVLEEDLDGNGHVNFLDAGVFKLYHFGPPGPSGIPNVCDEP